ncbi:MAG: orotidine-5'-phosphate decarboxylase [Pseudohongiellaceae bacterium]|jgi:orotidine-5'-phosphate decarboxylase
MNSRIIVALDFESSKQAANFLDNLDPEECRVKIGKELFTASGPDFVRSVIARGFDVFLDLKYHDIPNTVAKAAAVAADLGVWMLNVHASGGMTMMSKTREALERFGADRPKLIAVTVLTSMVSDDLAQIGVRGNPLEQVVRLATLTKEAGLDGVVCSAVETSTLRKSTGPDFCLVTPGIRRLEDAVGDQKRVVGPGEAIANGSDYLVVGRPITKASSPNSALAEFNLAVAGAVKPLV